MSHSWCMHLHVSLSKAESASGFIPPNAVQIPLDGSSECFFLATIPSVRLFASISSILEILIMKIVPSVWLQIYEHYQRQSGRP